ncbi:MAG: pectate lyase [Ignavibacteriaceae bacterium]
MNKHVKLPGFNLILLILIISQHICNPQTKIKDTAIIDITGFFDSAHHWKDITDHTQAFLPVQDQKYCRPTQIKEIADNILLYQQKNGGWPKNYDMLAILTPDQKAILKEGSDSLHTSFDNGATYSHVEYLAKAYSKLKDERYKQASLRGIDFILKAQYPNGGWSQFYPDTSGYRKYITFNDDAMVGILNVLHDIVQNKPYYNFIVKEKRERVNEAFNKGINCILKCQIKEDGKLTVWCQQHDNIDFHPRGARTFELPSKCGEESTGITLLLMSLEHPGKEVINSVRSAVIWFKDSKIHGIRVERIKAPEVVFKYRTSVTDKKIVKDLSAPPIWARFYTLKGNKPFFTDRNSLPVYSLSEVGRERRDGYTWYTYEPQKVLDAYPKWIEKIKKFKD